MGNLLAPFQPVTGSSRRVIVLGLDDSGTTTLVSKIQGEDVETMTPVAGFVVTTFTHKGMSFMTWDMSNERHVRRLWRHYFQFCDAIVFVMDASDRDRVEEAADKLHEILQFEELADAKLLVLANKQDRPDCMTLEEIQQKLSVRGVAQNAVHIEATIATSGVGVYEGLNWLADQIQAT